MSSFNINGPSSNQPIIQGSQSLGKDGGGGGNTGYMNMRQKKEGKKQNEEDNSVFLGEALEDTFEKEGEKKKPAKKGKLLGAISSLIKDKLPLEKSDDSDSFTKSKEPSEKEDDGSDEYDGYYEQYEDMNYTRENNDINKDNDDEYEITEDDDYYDGIDV